MAALKLLLTLSLLPFALGKGSEAQIQCTPEVMKVSVPMDGDRQITYLDQLKDYPLCKPTVEGDVATYLLDLLDPHQCGVTRVLHTPTGAKTFYHNIIIQDADGGLETLNVRCTLGGKRHTLTKRDTGTLSSDLFPVDLDEPEVVNITGFQEGHAPIPYLVAIVKQNGKQVSGEISVNPGTPLSMEIFLDNTSAPVYGLLVSYMHVTDTGKQQETIILNGCSVDPYLFDNFVTTDGDLLSAKFKAFKFPDTTYVQFKGTVSVCLDKCIGVQCTSGATGYGRRRRSIESSGDTNKLYEVALTTFIKVDWAEGHRPAAEDVTGKLLKGLSIANQKLGETETVYVAEEQNINDVADRVYIAQEQKIKGVTETVYVAEEQKIEDVVKGSLPGNSNVLSYSCLLVALSIVFAIFK